MSRTIWLVGMMGSGKSTVGAALASRLSCRFLDSDAEIERVAGVSVAEIFEREGEDSFRERERAVIAEWAGQPAVVALGGGAIAQPGAATRLARCGTVVYLRARPDTLLERIGEAETRPLLRGLGPDARRERLRALLDERRDAYESAALVMDTDDHGPEELASELAGRLSGQESA
jgi:shikimate kinase